MTSNIFEKAHWFVEKWEGGLTDDPEDAGMITKFGVSLRFYKTIKPTATAEDIRNLTYEQAKNIFKEHFWDKAKCDLLPAGIAFVLYDTIVNVGISQGVKFLQRVLGCRDDGIIGKNTVFIANSCCIEKTINAFIELRENFYKALVEKKPNQKVFLKGWLNRTTDLKKEVFKMMMDMA